MTTIADRIAAALTAATGETVPTPTGWSAATAQCSLQVRSIPGRRHESTARAEARDSLNLTYCASVRSEWTSVADMAGMARTAIRRARALAVTADILGRDRWHVTPLPRDSNGLRATKNGCAVTLYASGRVSGHDDVAARFIEELYEVALEETWVD